MLRPGVVDTLSGDALCENWGNWRNLRFAGTGLERYLGSW